MSKNPNMGRPRKEFSWDVVEALASVKATEKYIAQYLLRKDGEIPDEKNVDTKIKFIERRVKERWGVTFVEFRAQKQEDWKIELTQLQRKAARNGNITMQIFLGKQDLGQSDKQETKITEAPQTERIKELAALLLKTEVK